MSNNIVSIDGQNYVVAQEVIDQLPSDMQEVLVIYKTDNEWFSNWNTLSSGDEVIGVLFKTMKDLSNWDDETAEYYEE